MIVSKRLSCLIILLIGIVSLFLFTNWNTSDTSISENTLAQESVAVSNVSTVQEKENATEANEEAWKSFIDEIPIDEPDTVKMAYDIKVNKALLAMETQGVSLPTLPSFDEIPPETIAKYGLNRESHNQMVVAARTSHQELTTVPPLPNYDELPEMTKLLFEVSLIK